MVSSNCAQTILMEDTKIELQKYLEAKRVARDSEICPDSDHYDVVVIGAGLAGLAATITICNQGKKVLLLEQNDQVGGYAVNFWRGKYRFDGALHSLTGAQPTGAFYHALKELELEEFMEFIPIRAYKMRFDQKSGQSLYYDYSFEHFQTTMSYQFPDERAAIKKFFNDAQRLTKLLVNWNELSFHKKASRTLTNLPIFPKLLQFLSKNAADVLEYYFKDPELQKFIFSFVAGMGTPMHQLSAIVFFCMFFEKCILGSFYIKGGSGALTQAMAGKIESLGGEIILNAKVIGLDFDDEDSNKLKTVTFSDVRHPEKICKVTSNCFICCSDPHSLIEDLLPKQAIDEKYIKKITRRQNTESLFQVYLGLDIDLKEYGFNHYTNDFYMTDGKTIPINIYTNIDPACAPKGHSVIVSYEMAPIDEFEKAIREDGNKRGNAYKTLKMRKLNEIIDKLQSALNIPDLTEHIKVKEAATPITFKRYTKNFRGSYVGYISSFKQIVKSLPFQTPIQNLFIAGQWVNLGGGFQNTITGGIKAAKIALKPR